MIGYTVYNLFDLWYTSVNQRLNKDSFFSLTFARIHQLIGGRVRLMISGGAPLSGETQLFMQIGFGCSVIQGYGLTETCAGGTAQIGIVLILAVLEMVNSSFDCHNRQFFL